MGWIWIGVIFVLILIELISLNFNAIWFVISSIISYVLFRCNQNYIIQVSAFIVIGLLFIILIRPKVINKLTKFRDKVIEKNSKKYKWFKYIVPKELRIVENKPKKNKKKSKKSK